MESRQGGPAASEEEAVGPLEEGGDLRGRKRFGVAARSTPGAGDPQCSREVCSDFCQEPDEVSPVDLDLSRQTGDVLPLGQQRPEERFTEVGGILAHAQTRAEGSRS